MPTQKVNVKPAENGTPGKPPLATRKSKIFAISQPPTEPGFGNDIEKGKDKVVKLVNGKLNRNAKVNGAIKENGNDEAMSSPRPFHPFMYRDRMSWIAVLYTSIPDTIGLSGIKYAINVGENKIRRLFWILLIMAGFGLTCYQIVDRITYFLKYPTNINVAFDFEDQLPLPAIAICNINPYRRDLIEGTPFGNMVTHYVWDKTTFDVTPYEATLNGTNMTQLLLDLKHPLNDTVLQVKLGHEQLPISSFSTRFTTYGICYTFNSGEDGQPPIYVKASGPTFGLSVILHTKQEWYYLEERDRFSAGFHVILYDRGTEPVEDLGFSIKPGTGTQVALNIKEINNLAHPHGECEDKELVNYDYYALPECYNECMSDYIVSRCGCKPAALPGDAPDCDPIQYFGCGASSYGQFLEQRSGACDCPTPCFQRTYDREMSYSSFPSNYWANLLATTFFADQNVTGEYFTQNIAHFNVFFKDLTIQNVDQIKAYEFFSLMCDIGGSLGLWLGGSILTIFEFFDLFGHSIYVYSRKAR
ncbi:acid-sensing ion channel 2-like [Lytechinus pictus]|uniref:acid-sensing ion channel 2-like n=1 Tax=Lytechinus pictus TaxID=7653 RepID=UPI0030B9F9D2